MTVGLVRLADIRMGKLIVAAWHVLTVFLLPFLPSPDKLLYQVGLRGSGNGDFDYPRGICATLDCDIVVADSGNHRVQILNQFGVHKGSFGKRGSGEGEFDQPTDVVELPNGDLAVADRRNKRVQVCVV